MSEAVAAEGPGGDPVKVLVRRTFNAAAEHFDESPLFFWDQCGRRTVDLLDLGPGGQVLDVCCGSGASALPAAARVGPRGQVVGVDLADGLLTLARAKADERALTNTTFVAGDMDRLHVADGSMDAVVCVLGLYFSHDLPATVARLWRALRPGGVLAVTTWGERALEPLHSSFLDSVAHERPDLDARGATLSWERINSEQKLSAVHARARVETPEITREVITGRVSTNDAWSIVLGSGYRLFLAALSLEEAARVRADLYRRLSASPFTLLTGDVLYSRARRPGP